MALSGRFWPTSEPLYPYTFSNVDHIRLTPDHISASVVPDDGATVLCVNPANIVALEVTNDS